jgi:carbon monoxide dehydrogenase subunit G
MNFRSILALTCTTILVGCAMGGAKFNSRTSEAGTEPFKDVLMFFNAKSQHFTGTLYTNFVAATQRRIESCGVKVSVLEFDPLELDMRAKLTKTVEQSNVDAVLFFVRNGGNLVTGTGGVSGNLYFDTEVSDKKRTKTIWKARIDYRTLTQNMFSDDKLSAEKFAAQFVSKLASDGMIAGCPIAVTTPQ